MPPPMVSVDFDEPDRFAVSHDSSAPGGGIVRARELYAELRQISVESGSVAPSVDDIITNLNTSNESLASIIPMDKKEELHR